MHLKIEINKNKIIGHQTKHKQQHPLQTTLFMHHMTSKPIISKHNQVTTFTANKNKESGMKTQ